PVPLGVRDPVGGLVVRLPLHLDLPVGRLADVGRPGGVGHADLPPAARDRQFRGVLSGYTETLTPDFPADLHFPFCLVESSAWVVPRSTPTECPQRSASELIVGPPAALT